MTGRPEAHPPRVGETGRTPGSEAVCKRAAGRKRRSCRGWRNTRVARAGGQADPSRWTGNRKPPEPPSKTPLSQERDAAGGSWNGSRKRMHNRRRGTGEKPPGEAGTGRRGNPRADPGAGRVTERDGSRRGRTRLKCKREPGRPRTRTSRTPPATVKVAEVAAKANELQRPRVWWETTAALKDPTTRAVDRR